jgi:hypothetical protein
MATKDFRGLRRDVATALNGRRRTLYETAKAVGWRSGDIQRVVRQMHAEGILVADAEAPTRGTHYWLDQRYADALAEAVADAQPPGLLTSHQRMLELTAPDVEGLYEVLGKAHLSTVISWAAEWGGDGEWLVALSTSASKLAADRLVGALQKAGFTCRQRRVGDLFDGQRLQLLAVGVDDEVGASA